MRRSDPGGIKRRAQGCVPRDGTPVSRDQGRGGRRALPIPDRRQLMTKLKGRRFLAGGLLVSAGLLIPALAAVVPTAGAIPVCPDPPCVPPTTRTTRPTTTTTRPPNTFTWYIDANTLF